MSDPLIRMEPGADGVHALLLNRPAKRNALSIELRRAVAGGLADLAADEGCRAVVLSGAGEAFCAGMDVTQFGGDAAHKRRLFDANAAFFAALLDFPKPLVGAVNGAALGGGFVLALLCRPMLASAEAYFGFYEVRRGIPALIPVVRCLVDAATTADWCADGRRIEAAEALASGVVERIVDGAALIGQARAVARRLAGGERRLDRGLHAAIEAINQEFRQALFPPGN